MQIFDGSASRSPPARSAGPAAAWFATAYSSQQRMRTHARTDRQVENVMPAASAVDKSYAPAAQFTKYLTIYRKIIVSLS